MWRYKMPKNTPNPRFIEMAKRMASKEPPKAREEEPKDSGLAQILEKDENGKPKLKLTPLEKTAVNTKTQDDYWTLMRVYECGGWRWRGGKLPIEHNHREKYEEETCIEAGVDDQIDGVYNNGKFGYCKSGFYSNNGWKIISPHNFYDKQKITPAILNEINNWYKENGK